MQESLARYSIQTPLQISHNELIKSTSTAINDGFVDQTYALNWGSDHTNKHQKVAIELTNSKDRESSLNLKTLAPLVQRNGWESIGWMESNKSQTKRVFLCNIPLTVENYEIKESLGVFGEVRRLFICVDKRFPHSSYGFAVFYTSKSAEKAISSAGLLIRDRYVKIKCIKKGHGKQLKSSSNTLSPDGYRISIKKKEERNNNVYKIEEERYWVPLEIDIPILRNQRLMRNIEENHYPDNLSFRKLKTQL